MVLKGHFPYELYSDETGGELTQFPTRQQFISTLRNSAELDEAGYQRTLRIWELMKLKNTGELMEVYCLTDTIGLGVNMEHFYEVTQRNSGGVNPKSFSSMSTFSLYVGIRQSKVIITGPQDLQLATSLESSVRGGYSDGATRLCFDTRLFSDENKDVKILVPLKEKEEDSSMNTVKASKSCLKAVFSTVVVADENSQYPTMMTKPLLYGRWEKLSPQSPPSADYETWEDWLKNYDFGNSEVGYLLTGSFQPPDNLESAEFRSVELFNPMLTRESVSLSKLSAYQLYRKRNVSGSKLNAQEHLLMPKGVNYKKIVVSDSTISRLGDFVETVYGQLLSYCVKNLNFKVLKVFEVYSFRQSPWLRDYIKDNTERRKVCIKKGDKIGSNSEKMKSNTAFGALTVRGNNKSYQCLFDHEREYRRYSELNEKSRYYNPWIDPSLLKDAYDREYNIELEKLDEQRKVALINEKEYVLQASRLKMTLKKKRESHKELMKKSHKKKVIDVFFLLLIELNF